MHVLASLDVGGAETLVLRLVERLSLLGYKNQVVTLRRRGALAAQVEALGVPVFGLDVPASRGALWLAAGLARVVRRERPDVIHSHNLSPLIAAALATLVAPGARLVHTEHGRSSADTGLARLALRLASRRAAVLVAVSANAAEWAVNHNHLPRERIRVIRNGVALSMERPAAREPAHRALTVARLERVKDLATMIRATALVVARLPAFHLDIYGDGAERGPLERLTASLALQSHITFHGFATDITGALSRADLFLSSSLSEGIALSLLEAMAAGLPVVATAVGGTPEVVLDGVTGRLVPPARPDEFADAVCNVLLDPAHAARLGEASRRRIEAEFSLDAMVESYRQLYDAP